MKQFVENGQVYARTILGNFTMITHQSILLFENFCPKIERNDMATTLLARFDPMGLFSHPKDENNNERKMFYDH